MSLGDYTKCDLSAGIAKLDITILEEQLSKHLYLCSGNIRGILDQLNDNINMSDRGSLMRNATNIAKTTELLLTIRESTRRKIECVHLLKG